MALHQSQRLLSVEWDENTIMYSAKEGMGKEANVVYNKTVYWCLLWMDEENHGDPKSVSWCSAKNLDQVLTEYVRHITAAPNICVY